MPSSGTILTGGDVSLSVIVMWLQIQMQSNALDSASMSVELFASKVRLGLIRRKRANLWMLPVFT